MTADRGGSRAAVPRARRQHSRGNRGNRRRESAVPRCAPLCPAVPRRRDGRAGGKADVAVAGRKARLFSSSAVHFLAETEAALCPGGAVLG